MPTNLTVILEDRPGMLAQLGEALGGAGINIDGGCAVTSEGEGWVHILVEDAAAARAALEGAGLSVSGEREVVVVDAENRAGELGATARKLAEAGVNVELFYVSADTKLVFGVDDAEKARSAL
ncbi:MAG: ACT domain-containing protein [Chloroflexi bacterium]|nr:ACT domain-containing protein [Chloroflexota bacterium]